MDYAEKLWDLSNAITAFVILQALTFSYHFQNPDFRPQVGCLARKIETGIVVMTIIYILAIAVLNHYQLGLVEQDPHGLKHSAANLAFVLRFLAIIGANGLMFYLTQLAGNAWFASKTTTVSPAS